MDQGATLFDAGDDAANIYFVQNGTVDLSVKKSKTRPARRIMRVMPYLLLLSMTNFMFQ